MEGRNLSRTGRDWRIIEAYGLRLDIVDEDIRAGEQDRGQTPHGSSHPLAACAGNIPSTLRIKHLARLPSRRMGGPEAAPAANWPVATAAL